MAIFYLDESTNEQVENISSEQLLDNLAEACDSMMDMLDESRALDRYIKDKNEKKEYTPGYDVSKKDKYSGQKGKDVLEQIYGSRKNYDREVENDYHRAMSFKQFGHLDQIKRLNSIPDDELAKKKPNSVKDAQDKKRGIKETCLYILSILDEI